MQSVTYGITANEGQPRMLTGGATSTAQLQVPTLDWKWTRTMVAAQALDLPIPSHLRFEIFLHLEMNPGLAPQLLFDSEDDIESRLALLVLGHANSSRRIQSGDQASNAR